MKRRIIQSGYSVKDIQKLLSLSCPQPVYRWYAGKVLPSVDHLYALSRALALLIVSITARVQAVIFLANKSITQLR